MFLRGPKSVCEFWEQRLEHHERALLRASLEPQGPRDPPCVKERKILVQDSPNESSVRPNGTPDKPILRSRKNSEVPHVFFVQIVAPVWFR